MNINLKNFRKELLFLPLGGSGEIGLNCNLYHYDGKWLMIDCGIGFTKDVPGVDITVPDISFVKMHKKDLIGIVLTHMHEDHIGALQYLWEELGVPVYTSKITATLLKEKMSNTEFLDRIKIREIQEGTKLKLFPFDLEFIGLTHSTPEMNAILIRTEKGNILHTGDWKFERNPDHDKKASIQRLQELGEKREILATVCDSTNIFTEGESRSEKELFDSFVKIVAKKKGLVICTTFASNISRVKMFAKVAKTCERKVYLAGSSLLRIVRVGKATGYIPENMQFLSDKDLKKFRKNEILVLATGCQGEKNAALDRIAHDMHPKIKLNDKDTVIFSSKIIPGNEKSLMQIYNKLSEKDVEIITEENAFVHVSGHYTRNDLIRLYKMLNPHIAIATHGEMIHLAEHKRVAKECGIQKPLKAKNGAIMKIDPKDARIIDQIELKNVAVDGKRLLSMSDKIIRDRGKIVDAGIIFVNLIIDKKYRLMGKPTVIAPGAYDLQKDIVMKEIFEEDIEAGYNKAVKELSGLVKKKARNKDGKIKFETEEDRRNFIGQEIRKTINTICMNDIGKKPVIKLEFSVVKSGGLF